MNDAQMHALAERHGTPLHLLDLDRIRARFGALRAAFPDAEFRYAVKANPSTALLALVAASGAGAETITEGELARAVRAGIPGERLLISGPGQGPELRRRARDAGAALASLDSEDQWRAWRGDGPGRTRFLIRVNPGFDPGTHPHLATGAADSKFGLPPGRAAALAAEVAADGVLDGFHVHAGSMLADASTHPRILDLLAPLFDRFDGARTVDLGGGFAPDADLAPFAAAVLPFVRSRGLRLILEPGRWPTADAGRLLTRVLARKEGATVHWICDAGMAQLARPALYGAEHPIRVVPVPGRPPAPVARGEVQGPLCENADRLGRDRTLAAGVGDLLEVGQVGAYGTSMESNYASSLRPAEVTIEHGAPHLARRAETVDDLWRHDVGPD